MTSGWKVRTSEAMSESTRDRTIAMLWEAEADRVDPGDVRSQSDRGYRGTVAVVA